MVPEIYFKLVGRLRPYNLLVSTSIYGTNTQVTEGPQVIYSASAMHLEMAPEAALKRRKW
jgi:hypothetical protein